MTLTTTIKDLLYTISQYDTVSLSTVTLVLLSLIVLHKLLFTGRRLPPGPRGLPILGNLLSLDPELHSHLADLARTHGPIFKLRLGTKLCVVVSSPELAKQVLKDNDVVFANRDVPAVAGIGIENGRDIVWTPYGPEWRMLRKVAAVKMLSNSALDSVYELRRRELRNTVRYFYNRVGSKVNVGEQVFLTVLNVVTNMLWGGSVEGEEERERVGSEFRELVSEINSVAMKPNVSDFYPVLARFDLQGRARQIRSLYPKLDRMFEELISQRSEKMKSNNESESKNDFLQYLLLQLSEEQFSNTTFTMGHVKALLLDMVTGGTDTSSNAIELAMAEIINQPHIMKKAQQELDDIVGKDNVVEESHIHKLTYLQAVMKESLRLHPVLPLLVPHSPSQTCTIGGYTIPKGSRVFVNVWSIHRNPSCWDYPLKFDPERFLSANSKFDFSGSDFKYFPFGSGRRICAGISMAERMVLYSLASLLHSFDWNVPAGEKLDLSEKFVFVLKKKTSLVAVPTPRLSPKLYT